MLVVTVSKALVVPVLLLALGCNRTDTAVAEPPIAESPAEVPDGESPAADEAAADAAPAGATEAPSESADTIPDPAHVEVGDGELDPSAPPPPDAPADGKSEQASDEEAAASLVEVPDANITMGTAEADGQRTIGLSCAADRTPLLGSAALLGGLGKAKKALDKCAPKGAAVLVHWDSSSSGASGIEVRGPSSDATKKCVAKALTKVKSPFSGRCGAVLLIGDNAGADASLGDLLFAE